MVGIGYRKDFASEFIESKIDVDFIEVAPENWIGVGGYWRKHFDAAIEKHPLFTHGLSLSIGSPDPLNFDFLKQVKHFLDHTGAKIYSEHLSFTSANNAHLYELLPIPFTQDAVNHVVEKIKTVQDFLERTITLEIASYYTAIAPEMTEAEFINSIIKESGCNLLLDINNIYVNAFNHNYNAIDFIEQLPLDKVAYIHMAGHQKVNDSLIIDTHGSPIITPVYDLYAYAVSKMKNDVPVLLERDFNIPELKELSSEIENIKSIKAESKLQKT